MLFRSVADGVVRLPLTFGPTGSVFVVFREKAAPKEQRIVSVTRNGAEIPIQLTRNAAGKINVQDGQAGDYQFKFADDTTRALQIISPPAPLEITGPWEVSFAPGRGAPEKITFDQLTDWTKRPEESIKHFSGKATYQRTFEVLAQPLPGSAMILDLGEVNDIAVVRVNGQELATLWLPPYRLDITAAMKPGANTLEVDVVNTWNNRLVGDASLLLVKRLTSLTSPLVTKDPPLMPAGLIGPVTIQQAVEFKGL